MIAPAPRRDADATVVAQPSKRVFELWNEAVLIRQEWLGHGLSTQPADRATAERALAAIYARVGRPRPHFEWVESPIKALPLIAGLPTLDELYRWIRDPCPQGTPPIASDLAALVSSLRSTLSEGLVSPDPELSPPRRPKRDRQKPWPELPPRDALAFGIPLAIVLDRGVRRSLFRSLADGWYLRVRAALATEGSVPVCWYGQQDASWVAYYDALHRLGLARYGPWTSSQPGRPPSHTEQHFGEWADVVRTCGWWWPGEDRCVVVERAATVRTEAVPGADYGELRLVRDGVVYRDGWRSSG